jgi:hypothetical protein
MNTDFTVEITKLQIEYKILELEKLKAIDALKDLRGSINKTICKLLNTARIESPDFFPEGAC